MLEPGELVRVSSSDIPSGRLALERTRLDSDESGDGLCAAGERGQCVNRTLLQLYLFIISIIQSKGG